MNSNLIDFKNRFTLDDSFMSIVESLFNKLSEFGYIGNSQKIKLMENLNNNIDYLIIGDNDKYDYKSGYYDANKKTLYIKDKNNIKAIYLRLLYAITTQQIDNNSYMVGFSTTKLAKTNYKLNHKNFSINRAVFSNIVCKLLGSLPTNIGITPTYKTYTQNFLGYKITSENDIYYLEGKILSEMCFALNIDEQLIYSSLFSNNPQRSLEKIFEKSNFQNCNKFLNCFDKVSRSYSNYNKLNFLATELNLNYIEMKKRVLDDSIDDLKIERQKINSKIESTLIKLNNVESLESELEISLSETIDNLEESILRNITSIQNILSDNIITSIAYLTPYKYASKLKQFNGMLIFPNKKVNDAIFNTIIYKIMPDNELTAINIIQKIRYTLINHILFNDKYTDISKKIGFYCNIKDINPDLSIAHSFITVNNRFSHVAEINMLDKNIKKLNNNCKIIPVDNLKYLLNSDYSNMHVDKIEKVVSSLRNSFPEFKQTTLDNMYTFTVNNKEYLIVDTIKRLHVFNLSYNAAGYLCIPIELSNYFSLFYQNSKNDDVSVLLPVKYKKSLFKKSK